MAAVIRWSVEWVTPEGRFVALEPNALELAAAAAPLAAYYNEAHNREMMAHQTLMTEADVREHFESLQNAGGRAFLLFLDWRLMGDADLRHVEKDRAECAIMIGARSEQGRGLGGRYLELVHVLAFGELGLSKVFASIIPANTPSQRAFQRFGYTTDDSPDGRRYAEAPTDLTYSIDRETFQRLHAAVAAGARVTARPPLL